MSEVDASANWLKGCSGDWEVVIGLEVHAQIATASKLFSGAPTAFGAAPNTQVSFVDAAMPGMLPVANRECVRHAVRTGLAMGCAINLRSVFARKNYFYPDLPQGYQISQYDEPVVGRGAVTVDLDGGATREVGIERLHLEQDAGKSVHDLHPGQSAIDLNRAGVALMEIVTMPDMRSADEAAAFLTKLRAILRSVGSCDGNMQEGSMRADANVSVRRPGGPLGDRCEIKNLNSIRFLKQAVRHEARRQIALIEDGGAVAQETRLFDTARGETRAMRDKEDAHDYRYFPDPDLPPLMLDAAWVEELRAGLPELPDARRDRFQGQYGVGAADAALLAADHDVAAYYESVAAATDPAQAARWVVNTLFAHLNETGRDITDSPVPAAALARLINLVRDGAISATVAKDVFADMAATGRDAAQVVREKGLEQISDTSALEAAVDAVLSDSPKQVAQYRAGKTGLLGWFTGQVMKATRGRANPRAVGDLLRQRLDQSPDASA